jgi:hypothetical protein
VSRSEARAAERATFKFVGLMELHCLIGSMIAEQFGTGVTQKNTKERRRCENFNHGGRFRNSSDGGDVLRVGFHASSRTSRAKTVN